MRLQSLLWLLLWCPMERTFAGKKGKKADEDAGKKIPVPHHSFAVPLEYQEVLNDWMVSGASLAEKERLLLHPSVPERAAFVWNKDPLLTNDFEAIVQFRVVGPKEKDKVVKDQSFAIWYVYENITAAYNETSLIAAPSWKAGLDAAGMTLSGSKARFNGFGVIFSMADSQGNAKPMVSLVSNDGTRDLVYGKDVPTSNAKAIDFRNTLHNALFKLRITPSSIEGHLKQSKSLSWNECFKIDRTAADIVDWTESTRIKPGGYVGLSAWSGTAAAGTVSDMISIMQFEVNNYDTNSIGEEMKDVSKDIQDAYRNMLTDESRHFGDQKSQTEALDRLTRMLKEHADADRPAEEKMFQDLEALQGRMGKLDEDCRTVVKELQVLVNPDGTSSDGGIKDGIIGIRRLLVKDSASHAEKLDMVQKKMQEVKQRHVDASKPEMFAQVLQRNDRLQKTVTASSGQTTWMLAAIVVCIAGIGYLMYNRMQYYERKHFL